MTLPDSPVTEGRRTIRTILVIDEAHNYLSQKNIFLQRIIREGRSKGVVVFFASQSSNDYLQKFLGIICLTPSEVQTAEKEKAEESVIEMIQ